MSSTALSLENKYDSGMSMFFGCWQFSQTCFAPEIGENNGHNSHTASTSSYIFYSI
jgi:hypothetical protein